MWAGMCKTAMICVKPPHAQAFYVFRRICDIALHTVEVLSGDGKRVMAELKKAERPLSPHLQIYRPMLTMMMSIFHRATGMALYAGVVLMVWWLTAAATSDEYFSIVQGVFGHWFGRLVLFGFTWALVHHAVGGLRHLLWDTGRGFDLPLVELMAKATVGLSVVITILLWVIGYGVMS